MGTIADAPVSTILARSPRTARLDDTLGDVRDVMVREGIHHVVVVDDDVVVGIVSDRDVVSALSPVAGNERVASAADAATLRKRVHQVMSHHIVTIHAGTPVADAVRLMLDHGFHSVPVVDDLRHPVGIVTSVDAMRWALEMAAEAEAEAEARAT